MTAGWRFRERRRAVGSRRTRAVVNDEKRYLPHELDRGGMGCRRCDEKRFVLEPNRRRCLENEGLQAELTHAIIELHSQLRQCIAGG